MKRPIIYATAATLFALASSPALALQIYVSNEKDNTVTVIDGTTLQVLKTIPTARRPRGIIASPDGKEVYVAARDGDIMT
jgi:YVTN family beta-propeller protein